MYSRRRTCESKLVAVNLALDLFSCFSDKTEFGRSYEIRLAERLLSGEPVDSKLESEVVDRLETICGSQFALKMRGMLFDAGSESISYPGSSTSTSKRARSITVKSMNTSYWPKSIVAPTSESTRAVHLPGPFLQILESLQEKGESWGAWTDREDILLSPTEGQCTLQWSPQSSSTEYRIVCTPVQAMILHCIGASKAAGIDSVSASELHRLLKLDDQRETAERAEILKRALHSLACHPTNSILKKTPANMVVRPTDRFAVREISDWSADLALVPPSRNTVKME